MNAALVGGRDQGLKCVGTCGKLVGRRHGQQLLERAGNQLRAFVEQMLLNGTPLPLSDNNDETLGT